MNANENNPLTTPSSTAMALAAPQTATTLRVAQSRERLREAMMRHGGGSRSARASAGPDGRQSGGGWLSGLRSHPVASLALGALDAWWRVHPLRIGASMTQGMVSPWVHRHPLVTVAGAVVVGGLMVRARPWRWLAKRALVTGIASYMLRNALRHVPIGSLLGMVSSWGISSVRSAGKPSTARRRTEARPPSAPLH